MAKDEIVQDALTHIDDLGTPRIESTIPAPQPYGYLNSIELVVGGNDRALILAYPDQSHPTMAPPTRCALLPTKHQKGPAAIQGALRFLTGRYGDLGLKRVGIRVSAHTRDVEIALWSLPGPFPRSQVARTLSDAIGATGVVRVLAKDSPAGLRPSAVEVLSGRGAWRERVGAATYLISAPSTFRANTAATETLVRVAIEALGVTENSRVLDLYAGAGVFTVPLARTGAEVVAIESSRFAIADLRRNLEMNQSTADVVGGDPARETPTLGTFDAACIDAPPKGLEPAVITSLGVANPKRIVYISPDPVTLARDAIALTALNYRLASVQPVDLRPQTPYVETVSVFERNSRS